MLIALAQFPQDCRRFKNKTITATITITITIKKNATIRFIMTIPITIKRTYPDAHSSCSVFSGLSEV